MQVSLANYETFFLHMWNVGYLFLQQRHAFQIIPSTEFNRSTVCKCGLYFVASNNMRFYSVNNEAREAHLFGTEYDF